MSVPHWASSTKTPLRQQKVHLWKAVSKTVFQKPQVPVNCNRPWQAPPTLTILNMPLNRGRFLPLTWPRSCGAYFLGSPRRVADDAMRVSENRIERRDPRNAADMFRGGWLTFRVRLRVWDATCSRACLVCLRDRLEGGDGRFGCMVERLMRACDDVTRSAGLGCAA